MSMFNKLREIGDSLKSSKEALADRAISVVTQEVTDFLGMYVLAAEVIASASRTGLEVVHATMDDTQAQAQVKALVAHVIGDVASRINEAANFAEYISKNPKVQASCAQTARAWEATVRLATEQAERRLSVETETATTTETVN